MNKTLKYCINIKFLIPLLLVLACIGYQVYRSNESCDCDED